jgi:hypothetical protein
MVSPAERVGKDADVPAEAGSAIVEHRVEGGVAIDLGPVALSLQKQRHRICSRIWYEVDERWSKAAMRPSPWRTTTPP